MPSGCAVQNKQKPHCASLIVFWLFFSPQFTKTFMIIYFVVRGTKQITLYLKGINTAGLCCSGSRVCVYYCAVRSTYTHAQVHAENETPLLLSCFHLHCSARADGVRNPGFTSWNEKKQRERWERVVEMDSVGLSPPILSISITVRRRQCCVERLALALVSSLRLFSFPSLSSFLSIFLLIVSVQQWEETLACPRLLSQVMFSPPSVNWKLEDKLTGWLCWHMAHSPVQGAMFKGVCADVYRAPFKVELEKLNC